MRARCAGLIREPVDEGEQPWLFDSGNLHVIDFVAMLDGLESRELCARTRSPSHASGRQSTSPSSVSPSAAEGSCSRTASHAIFCTPRSYPLTSGCRGCMVSYMSNEPTNQADG